ncbi:hypothetical protein AEQ48_04855 [Pseudomonas libanensis]|uniref:Lipoprotein n=1 Tax=Pseudomonas libanensis TaxID=75588 RepID=A0ABR5MBY4_9PSED|nr:hypothetical protein AEQ48_04855 [Pseudomonas libanensis]KRA21462.1 hypothetical protein ASD70_21720 [Pseudomonas sp. Root569]
MRPAVLIRQTCAYSLLAIQQVCKGASGEDCRRIKFTEAGKFAGATFFGGLGGWAALLSVSQPL